MIIGNDSIDTTLLPELTIDGVTVEFVSEIKSLGIHLIQKMDWNKSTNETSRHTHFSLYELRYFGSRSLYQFGPRRSRHWYCRSSTTPSLFSFSLSNTNLTSFTHCTMYVYALLTEPWRRHLVVCRPTSISTTSLFWELFAACTDPYKNKQALKKVLFLRDCRDWTEKAHRDGLIFIPQLELTLPMILYQLHVP